MESTFTILIDYIKEFIPANKGHVLSLGIGLVVVGFCIALTAQTSGLTGNLTYLALHPGTSGPLMGAGAVLAIAAMVMKLPAE
jgi:hypothetical protein